MVPHEIPIPPWPVGNVHVGSQSWHVCAQRQRLDLRKWWGVQRKVEHPEPGNLPESVATPTTPTTPTTPKSRKKRKPRASALLPAVGQEAAHRRWKLKPQHLRHWQCSLLSRGAAHRGIQPRTEPAQLGLHPQTLLGAIFGSGFLWEITSLKTDVVYTRSNSFASGVGVVQEVHAVDAALAALMLLYVQRNWMAFEGTRTQNVYQDMLLSMWRQFNDSMAQRLSLRPANSHRSEYHRKFFLCLNSDCFVVERINSSIREVGGFISITLDIQIPTDLRCLGMYGVWFFGPKYLTKVFGCHGCYCIKIRVIQGRMSLSPKKFICKDPLLLMVQKSCTAWDV